MSPPTAWWGGLALLVLNLGYGALLPWAPALSGRVGVGAADTLALAALTYAVGKLGAQLPAGRWVDRVGATALLRPLLALDALALLILLAGHPASFLLGRTLDGVAVGLGQVAVLAVVAEGEPATVGRRLGTATGLGMVGLLLGPLLALGVGERGPVWVVGIVGLLLGAVAWAAPRARGVRRPLAPASWRALACSAPFLALVLPVAAGKLAVGALEGVLPLLGPACCGRDPSGVAVWMLVLVLAFGLAQPVVGWLADRLPARALVGVGGALACGGLAWAGQAEDRAVLLGLAGFGIGQAAVFTASLRALLVRRWPAAQGEVLGLHGAVADAVALAGPAAVVYAYGRVEAAALGLLAGAVAVLLGLSLALWGRVRGPPGPPATPAPRSAPGA